jgi:hypothetical protein
VASAVSAVPPSPKSHAYVSGVLPSASVAVPVNWTVSGAVPLCGAADAVTDGGELAEMPRPRKSTQLTFSRPPVLVEPAGRRAMKNSGPVAAPDAGRSTVTSV